MTDRKAKSPYQRYQKTPFVYSEAYRRWKSAVKDGRDRDASIARTAHRQHLINLFGPRFFYEAA